MFTGLVQTVGRIAAMNRSDQGISIAVEHDPWESGTVLGESIAVQGVCLTVSAERSGRFECDMLDETARLTSLGGLGIGSAVNLERSLAVGQRFGGHIVTGHVDGTGTLLQTRQTEQDRVLRVRCSSSILDGIVLKGSITCDGISLTVTAVDEEAFEVRVIPFTWAHTSLRHASTGQQINLETDILGKYVKRYLSEGVSLEKQAKTPLSFETLRNAGFLD